MKRKHKNVLPKAKTKLKNSLKTKGNPRQNRTRTRTIHVTLQHKPQNNNMKRELLSPRVTAILMRQEGSEGRGRGAEGRRRGREGDGRKGEEREGKGISSHLSTRPSSAISSFLFSLHALPMLHTPLSTLFTSLPTCFTPFLQSACPSFSLHALLSL